MSKKVQVKSNPQNGGKQTWTDADRRAAGVTSKEDRKGRKSS